MHLVIDFRLARRDRIQPRRRRPQRRHQRVRVPRRRPAPQHVDQLVRGEQRREFGLLRRCEQAVEFGRFRLRRVRCEEGPRQARQFAPCFQPFGQRQLATVVRDDGAAVELQRIEHGIAQHRRVVLPNAERVAGFVAQAAAGEREFEMAHVLGAVASAQALVGEQFGRERALARPTGCWRCMGPQRGHVCCCCGRFQQVAGMAQRRRGPGRRDRLDIEIGLAGREQACRAQFRQARIDAPRDAAELRIARIAEAEHGELQFRQHGRALAGEEFDEADGIVGRIALALGADDDVQQALARKFTRRIRICAQQPHAEPGAFQFARQRLGRAARVAGLAAEQHGGALRVRGGRSTARQQRQGGMAWRLRQSGGVARQPPQPGSVEPVHQPRQQGRLLSGQRWCGKRQGLGGHGGCRAGTGLHPRSRARRVRKDASPCRHAPHL